MLPKGIKFGNTVRIERKSDVITGTLLPRSELYSTDYYTLKLESGYNVGIDKKSIVSIQKVDDGVLLDQKQTSQELKNNKKLPKIGVVCCGGTITSRLDYASGGVKHYTDARALFSMCPSVFDIAAIDSIKNPVAKDSSEIESDDWKKIASDVFDYVADDAIEGVLVLIGTDSLHYSAAALSFMIKNLNKPVVLTYSARSTDRASTDALLNIEAAVRMCVSKVPSVLVVGHATSNDTVCQALRGTTVRKMHTSRRDTFRPINDTPVAMIENGEVQVLQQIALPAAKPILQNQFEKKVAYIHYMPNMDPDILRYYMKNGYTGAVISMLGLGQIAATQASNNWLPVLQEVIQHGMIVCAVPQTLYGALQPQVYSTGRYLSSTGVLYLQNMLAEVAYVKLSCALGRWSSKKTVEQFMLTNVAGELQEIQTYGQFLL